MKDWGGRKVQALRARVFAAHGTVCHLCGAPGADTIDHLDARVAGGVDDLSNLAPAHKSCNSARGGMPLAQWRAQRAPSPYAGLPMPGRVVVLLAGPPGAGKTTRARALCAAEGLTLLDRDDPHWSGERAFREALTAVGADPRARAVVIRSCATRAAWVTTRDLIGATRTELLAPPARVCRDRIAHDGARVYTGRTWIDRNHRLSGVTTWWREHDAAPWRPEALAPSRVW